MKKLIQIIGGALLVATALFFGAGAIEAKAADIPYIAANGRDSVQQMPDQSNNCQLIVTLKYPKAVNGYYHQAVRVVLREVSGSTAVSYIEENYVKVKDGSATVEAAVPSWNLVTRFGTPCHAGTYQIEVYTMTSPSTYNWLYTSQTFTVSGDRDHHVDWGITELGSTTRPQTERRFCFGCGWDNGECRTTSSNEIYLKECFMQIDATPQNGTVILQNSVINSYPKAFMQKLATRRDITTIIYLVYNGINYKVTIPAGVVVNVDYDYYGPLMLQALYGAEQVTYNPANLGTVTNLNAVTQAAAGDVVVLSGKDTYTRNDMLAISARRDITVIIKCSYKGTNYVVTIPAGAAVDTSCDYYGPLKLASLYPFTIAQQ